MKNKIRIRGYPGGNVITLTSDLGNTILSIKGGRIGLWGGAEGKGMDFQGQRIVTECLKDGQ